MTIDKSLAIDKTEVFVQKREIWRGIAKIRRTAEKFLKPKEWQSESEVRASNTRGELNYVRSTSFWDIAWMRRTGGESREAEWL